MKNTIKIFISLLAIGLVSCEAEFDNPVTAEGFYVSGEANLTNYVAVGNSLTAGYADGALYITGQENSYPNIMAQQFALAGGGEFTQPLMNDNLGGLLLSGNPLPGFGNRFVLGVDAEGNPGPIVLEGTPTTDIANNLGGPFNNMGVPGAKSFHLNAAGYGNISGVTTGAANPYYVRMATGANASVIADAAAMSPSFFSLWIGNNDILGYATSGGSGVDQAGNLDPTTYGSRDITDPNVFAASVSAQVDALVAGGNKGVILNIPDVTSIPYFTTVPAQSIPLDAATAAGVNAQYALYNTQVLPGLVGAGVISAQEASERQINFAAGVNFPVMTDDDLTDISAILQGPPFNLPASLAGLLGQLRQANNDDLVVLTAASVLGSLADPNDPTSVFGVAVPMGDEFILTAVEQGRVATATAAYNATIRGLAAANGLALVDAQRALREVANGGVAFDGGIMTSAFVTGGGFSLDGVHPTPRGYAYTANLIIDAINKEYGATIPNVNIGDYGTITAANNTGL